jgi:hypothetical protein
MIKKTPISWKEFKKVIASTFDQELLKVGFKNPAFKMYRFREAFIDVIQFYPDKYYLKYTIEFGTHPRKDKQFKGNKKSCWWFMFRGRQTKNGAYFWLDIPDTYDGAIKQVRKIEHDVIDQAIYFFDRFQTIEDAKAIVVSKHANLFLLLDPPVNSINILNNIQSS